MLSFTGTVEESGKLGFVTKDSFSTNYSIDYSVLLTLVLSANQELQAPTRHIQKSGRD